MIKPSDESPTQIFAGRVLGPPGSPAFALAGLRVSVADKPSQIAFTDASGDFRLIGVDLPEGTTLLVHRGEDVIGAGTLVPHGVIEIAPPAAPNVLTSPDSAAPLTVADRKLLFSLLAEIEGIDKAVIHAIAMGLAELALLETEARAFLAGERADVNVLALITEESPWNTKVPFFAKRAAEADEVFALISPGAPVLAGALLADELEHAGERAITAYLRRAEPLARLVRTARLVGAGAAKPETLAEMARWAAPRLAGPISTKDLVEQFRKGPTFPPQPRDPRAPRDPLWPPVRSRYEWLDPRNAEWLNCVFSVPNRVPPRQKTPKGPTGFFSVTPSAICKSAATGVVTLRLTATTSNFGAQADFPDWLLSVGTASVNITSWTSLEIVAEVTGLASGCNLVRWVYPMSPPEDVIGEACRQALRLPPWQPFVIPELPAPGSRAGVSVLDPLILGFTANGASAVVGGPTVTVEACTVISLGWSVNPKTCGDEGLVSVSLLRDGSVLAANLPFAGTRQEAADANHTYTLRVESKNSDGNACGTLDRTLSTTTFHRLTLILPPQITGGTSVKASVRVSCPAPAGGLSVTLVASPAGKVGVPASVNIPAGQREVEFDVAGQGCGGASLTASAPAPHNGATAATCVLRPPQFTLPTLAPLQACVAESFTLTASCVTAQVVATLISAAGERTRATVKLVSGGSGPCVGDAVLRITTTPMGAGAYDFELSDRGGATLSTTRLSFVSTPVVVKVSPVGTVVAQSACPDTIATLRVFARGADRVIGTVASTGVQVLIMRPESSDPCDEWTAEAEFAVVCPTDSINLVAVSGSAGAPPVMSSAPFTVPVQVNSSNVFSAISFRNQSGHLLRISISRLDPDGLGGKTRVFLGDTPLGSNPGNTPPTEFRFSLTHCAEYSYTVRQTFAGRETTVRDVPNGVIGGACGGVLDVLV